MGTGNQTHTIDPRANGFQKVPLPPDLQRAIPLTDNARTVLRKRYVRRDADGQPVETEQEMFWRVAYHIAKAEAEYGGEIEPVARQFYDLLTGLRFFPNSPTFTGAGTPLGQLAACFVMGIDDEMGRTGSGIFETLRNAALIQQTGGGNGFSFSRLRPKGAIVRSSSGKATGPVGFLRVYDQAFGEIAQGGCVTGDTLVATSEGNIAIRDLVGREPLVYSFDRKLGKTVLLQARDVRLTGRARDVYRLRTNDGFALVATWDHPVMVADGSYQALGGLLPGQIIMPFAGRGVVESIEFVGRTDVYDLEVPQTHNFAVVSDLEGMQGAFVHNSRRGANMAVLRVDHPDVREFITCKIDENAITNFNISVGVTDAFMQAVEHDADFELVNPQNGTVWETVRARELFDQIVRQAHQNGEPGVLFLDAANRENPVPHLYELESTNPCFVGNTRIATEHGLLTIEELAERGTLGFVATDNRAPVNDHETPNTKTYGVALRPGSVAWMTRQNVPVMKLTTQMGYSVTATPDHRFLTPRGYVELQHLKPGDKLLLQSGEGVWSKEYRLPNAEIIEVKLSLMALSGNDHNVQRNDFTEQYANIPQHWSHELGLVIGWLVGDGWVSDGSTRKSIGMVFENDAVRPQIHVPLSEWFGPGSIVERGHITQLTYSRVPFEFFRSLGVSTGRAHEKRVPEAIWTAPREAIVGFLQGLFGADGTVGINEKKQDCSVRLASSSPGLLWDVQILLSNFGIAGRIYLRRKVRSHLMPDGKGGQKAYRSQPQYELVLGKANRDRFAELIGFAHPEKQAKVEAFIGAKTRRSNAERYVDSVLSIENAGKADVYDLAQPQTHSLIANGLVVHNCGEQFLGPYENCCLGSINLARHMTPDNRVDWDRLRESIELSTRFLEDVVTANAYVPAVPELREAAHRVRRIGLGIMGLADMMYTLGVRYGSPEGQEFASQVMEFVRFHSMRTSIELARDRGPFPAIEGSLYDPADLKWQPPQSLVPHQHDWGRPALDWAGIVDGIRRYGIRNGAQTTVAPTGTISTVAGCEGYGCEPVFALAYMRYVNDQGQQLTLQYTSPLFEQVLRDAGLGDAAIKRIVEQVNLTGTCQDIPDVPERIRRVFVVSGDVSAEEHVRMQAALQAFTDNAISKTVNFPSTATEDDVATAYQLAWKLGCKGLTVYVTGSREKVVLETAETKQKKQGEDVEPARQPYLFNEEKKPRPRHLSGKTYRVQTPLGTTYITVNENGEGEGQPFEVFLHTAKAGSDTAAVSEALGRLISYNLRLTSPVSPRNRLIEMVRQLSGIGGARPIGFGPSRISSLPDGVAQVLQEYLDESAPGHSTLPPSDVPEQQLALPLEARKRLGDLCPECGAASLVSEEGCRKCYSCGFSEC